MCVSYYFIWFALCYFSFDALFVSVLFVLVYVYRYTMCMRHLVVLLMFMLSAVAMCYMCCFHYVMLPMLYR